MAKSVKKNYLYNLAYEIIVLVVPLITAPYLSRVLGSDGVGVSSYTLSVVSYFILFANLGVSSYGSREIAMARDDKKKSSKIFWELFLLKMITGVISLIGYSFVIAFSKENTIIYFILVMNILSNMFNITFLYQAVERFRAISIRNIVVKVLCTACVFIFVKDKGDLNLYVLIHSLSLILSTAILWTKYRQIVDFVPFKKLKPLSHLKGTFVYFLPGIATNIYTVLDKTMIGLITHDSAENGYYEQAYKIITMSLTVITSLNSVLYPRMSYLFEHKKMDEIKKRFNKSLNFVFLLSIPMCMGLASISKGFVPWFFGPGFEPVEYLLIVFSPIIIIIALSNLLCNQCLVPCGKRLQSTYCLFFGAFANVIANAILIPKYASLGATYGSLIAEAVICISLTVLAREYIDFKEAINKLYQYIIAGLLMSYVIYAISIKFDVSMITTFIEIIIGSLIYFGVMFLFKNEIVLMGVNMFKKKLKR